MEMINLIYIILNHYGDNPGERLLHSWSSAETKANRNAEKHAMVAHLYLHIVTYRSWMKAKTRTLLNYELSIFTIYCGYCFYKTFTFTEISL